jgi:hypothetical protein
VKYRNQNDGLDLHIVCFDTYYEDDYHMVTCRITYPGLDGQKPITIDYNPKDDSELSYEVVRATMLTDIGAFLFDPEGWVQRHVGQSGDINSQILAAQLHLDQCKEELEHHTKQWQHYTERVAHWQQVIQRLQTLQGELPTTM